MVIRQEGFFIFQMIFYQKFATVQNESDRIGDFQVWNIESFDFRKKIVACIS
jgi:hypothetical protein